MEGDGIPIHARIIGIVDCYDALTTDRTYRKALSEDDAIKIMVKETSDGLWDPKLFDILLDLLKRIDLN